MLLPFTACPNDFEEHGCRIYSELESGLVPLPPGAGIYASANVPTA
jgi:hypothetical protein